MYKLDIVSQFKWHKPIYIFPFYIEILEESTTEINTLTANYEYSRINRENLPLPIQIKLSKKP